MHADGGQAWLEQGQRHQVQDKNEEINEMRARCERMERDAMLNCVFCGIISTWSFCRICAR